MIAPLRAFDNAQVRAREVSGHLASGFPLHIGRVGSTELRPHLVRGQDCCTIAAALTARREALGLHAQG